MAATSENRAERVRQGSRARREQQKDSLRRQIFDAAGQLFLEHGYEGFSMRQVAERIGYSATTIYRYFQNKDDLLFAILSEAFARFGQFLTTSAEAVEAAGDPIRQLEALGRAYVKFGLQNPVHYQLMFMQRTDFLFESRQEEKQPIIESFQTLIQVVEAAMDSGQIERGDVETYSHVIWAQVHGLTALAVANPQRTTGQQVEQQLELGLKMIRDGLRPG